MEHYFTGKYSGTTKQLITPIALSGNGQKINATALWDTGANLSCISEEIAVKMGLTVVGFQEVKTPSGSFTDEDTHSRHLVAKQCKSF